jgi:hypothetical protein
LNIYVPAVESPGLRAVVMKDFFDFQRSEHMDRAEDVVQAASKVVPFALSLPANEGKTGFTLSITRRPIGTPIYTVQIGKILQPDPKYPGGKAEKYAEYAGLKDYILQINPMFIASRENSGLPVNRRVRSTWGDEIPGGALEINGWLISGSGLPKAEMDEAVILATAFGAKLAGLDQIESIARDPRVGCKEFLRNEDVLLRPFLK